MFKQAQSFVSVLFMCFLVYFGRSIVTEIFHDETREVNAWLDQNELGDYKKLFKEHGECLSFYCIPLVSIVLYLT